MKNILEKTFYIFYSITMHSEKKFQAIMMTALGFTLIFILVDSFLFFFSLGSLLLDSSKLIIGVIFAFWAMFFSYYFNYKERFKMIIKKYDNIEKQDRKKMIFIIMFIYGSIILLIILFGIIRNIFY